MKKIASLIFITGLMIFAGCQSVKENPEPLKIIPQPLKIEQFTGYFTLNAKTKLVLPNDESVTQVAGYLTDRIRMTAGIEMLQGERGDKKNVILFELISNNELGKEGYEMEVSGQQIVIRANGSTGLFYGVQTLLQLLPAEIFSLNKVDRKTWNVPCCKITDKPRFQWRGMHLDVSRHFFPVDFIKRYIDLIAMHKMNVFHWHLTDDNGWRIEIKNYPLLTDISAWRVNREDMPWREVTPPLPGEKATYGGFYTQEEIREVVQYAADRFITVIPEIEMPGHTCEVFAAYPELSCTGETLFVQPGSYWPNEDIFCAGKEETFEFIENVLLEVMELFPSEYIHIGGDEADKTRWKACRLCQQRIKTEKLNNEDELQSYFIRRIERFLNYHSKKLIGWDEILEGGLAPEATVMSWRGFKGGQDAAEMGHDVVMCPTSYCYFDYYQANPDFEPEAIGGFLSLKKVYSFEPVPEGLTPEKTKHILGAQGNLWTEYVKTPEHAEYMALPRMTALAEVVWTTPENKDWSDFRDRLNTQFKRFDQMKVNYSTGSWKVEIKPVMENNAFKVILDSEQPGKSIRYTTDGSEPDAKSFLYTEPFIINSSTLIKAAIFVDDKMKENFTEKQIVFHKALGLTGELRYPPSRNYYGNGAASLTDGLKGSNNFRDGYWIGFEGTDLDFELDLKSDKTISSVTLTMLQNTGSWIFLPLEVIFTFYDAAHQQIGVSRLVPETTIEAKGTVIEDMVAHFENINGRYIRIKAVNMKTCPEWHAGAGSKAWIFADEVVVE